MPSTNNSKSITKKETLCECKNPTWTLSVFLPGKLPGELTYETLYCEECNCRIPEDTLPEEISSCEHEWDFDLFFPDIDEEKEVTASCDNCGLGCKWTDRAICKLCNKKSNMIAHSECICEQYVCEMFPLMQMTKETFIKQMVRKFFTKNEAIRLRDAIDKLVSGCPPTPNNEEEEKEKDMLDSSSSDESDERENEVEQEDQKLDGANTKKRRTH